MSNILPFRRPIPTPPEGVNPWTGARERPKKRSKATLPPTPTPEEKTLDTDAREPQLGWGLAIFLGILINLWWLL